MPIQPRCCRRSNRARLLGLLVAALPVAATADCVDRAVSWQVAHVSNTSQWAELDVLGRKLVRETGTLPGMEFSVRVRCGDWNLQAQLSQLDGSRFYDGQTSTGVPVTSRSALRQLHGNLQATLNVAEAWQLGTRLSSYTLWREIASAGGASGYPERYDWTMLSVGAQWKTGLGPGQLRLAAWSGMKLRSSMLLSLPGRDQTVMQLGRMNQHELEAGWRTQLGSGWYLQGDVRYRSTDMGQGADAIIRRSGVPVGVAHQPRTTMVDIPVSIGIGYEF